MQAIRALGGCRNDRGQGGFSLLEAVVSLALVSTVVLGLAAGMLTALKSSTSAKSTQEVDAALSAYAESFKSLDGDCDTDWASEAASAGTVPDWLTSKASALAVSPPGAPAMWWDDSTDPGVWTPCSSSPPPSPGVIRLTVEVQVPTSEGPQSATGQVVVRNDP